MFKLLQTFVAVYETRSFSKAAAQRFISQPTVSVHIQQLEKELGAQLFHRNGRTEFNQRKMVGYSTKRRDIYLMNGKR